jgi:hypothetical protein
VWKFGRVGEESGRETICGDMTEGKALSKRWIGVSKVEERLGERLSCINSLKYLIK